MRFHDCVVVCMVVGLFAGAVNAQMVGTSISDSGSLPNTNAMLDIQSPATGAGKGLLIPRITQSQRTNTNASLAGGLLDDSGDLRGGPAHGLIVYQTDGTQGFYYNTSTNATPFWAYIGDSTGNIKADGSVPMSGTLDLAGNIITNGLFVGSGAGLTGIPSTGIAEADPVYSASPASGITSTDTSNWDGAWGWGNHGEAGYLTETPWIADGSHLYATSSTVQLRLGPSSLGGNIGTNFSITGGDNDGSENYPIHVTDEDGYITFKVRSSLSPGARFGANASLASFGGTVEAKSFMGGEAHSIDEGADYCFIGGGLTNRIESTYSDYSAIAGGLNNIIGAQNSSPYSFIGSGRSNIVDNDYGVIAGGRLNYISRLYSFIGGGRNNRVIDDSSVICGGQDNLINEYGEYCFIGGGYNHTIRSYNPSDRYNTIVGGYINSISNSYDGFIGGGSLNNISYGPFSTIGGGQQNISFEKGTTISGGRDNRIVGEYCTVGGGWSNRVDGYSYYSTIPGGLENKIFASNYGFAAGRYARIWHNGCFAWADSNPSTVDTTAENQFIARASGGFVFLSSASGATTGAQLPAGSGSWSSLSDRNFKENFTEINGRDVLDKISSMSISTWNYKAQDEQIRHAGPMAQDFHAAFGLGEDERHLSTVDVDGIALAAIKELKAQKDAEIGELKDQIEILMQRLDQLETP